MKKTLPLLFVFISIMIFGDMEFSGDFETYQRWSLKISPELAYYKHSLSLSLAGSLSENINYQFSPVIRDYGESSFYTLADLTQPGNLTDDMLILKEAYVKLNKFPFSFMDVSIGRQIESYGSGDLVSCLDIINPDDMSDPLRYDNKTAKEMLDMELYMGYVDFRIIYSPSFKPAIIPAGVSFFGDDYDTYNVIDTLLFPDENLFKSSEFFISASKSIAVYAISMFFNYGHTFTPAPKEIVIKMADIFTPIINATLHYPRVSSAGASISGTVADIGVWTDISVNYIKDNEYTIDMESIGRGVTDTFFIQKKMFYNILAGCDYTFTNGLYLNVQYSHGARGEYGEENLTDFLFVGGRIGLFNDKIRLEPFNLSYQWLDFGRMFDEGAILFYPKAVFTPFDNIEISTALIFCKGSSELIITKLKSINTAEIGLKLYF